MSKILQVEHLVQEFDLTQDLLDRVRFKDGRFTMERPVVHAVNDVSFDVETGEVFSLVGESGCGKSTTARTVIRLHEPRSGRILFEGRDITHIPQQDLRAFRRQIQMIFQDPYASLNPRQKILEILTEPILFHGLALGRAAAEEKAVYLLERVGLSAEQAKRYPHQFSGGQRQRIGIARALAVEPKFIIADEPVSALDVSIQAQILNILMDLKDEFRFSYLFIAHDLSVVKHISDSLGVMYLGTIVERASKRALFSNPVHPYTKALFSAAPTIDENNINQSQELKGEIPSPIHLPSGCLFHDRCPMAEPECASAVPALREVEQGHFVACHLVKEGNAEYKRDERSAQV